MQRIDWKHTAAVTVTLLGAMLGIYLAGRYVLMLFLPFLIALALSLITRPLVLRVARRGCPVRIAAALVTALALLLLIGAGYLLCSRLFFELRDLITFLTADSGDPNGKIATAVDAVKGLWQKIPFIEHLGSAGLLGALVEDPESFLAHQFSDGMARLSQRLTDAVVGAVGALPSVLLFLLVTLIACFYFAIEYKTVDGAVRRLLPKALRRLDWKERAGEAMRRYLRAYFLLFLLTLGELLVGFLILSVDYAFLLALVTAILDILPVLGVGTVLIPYAIFSFVTGSTALGWGVLVLYGIITVVRQIAEPRLVGKSLGLHPILMLISFYAGWKLFGVAGVFIGPLIAMIVKAVWGQTDNAENPIEDNT